MVIKAASNAPRRTSAGKLATAAVISMLLGLGLMALLLLILLVSLDSGSEFSELIQFLSGFGGLFLLFIVAPFLGILAVADAIAKRRDFKDPGQGPFDRGQILKTARSFLAASVLYVLLALSRLVAGIISPALGHPLSTTTLSVWFISIALLALLTGCIALQLFSRASSPRRVRIFAGCAVIAGLVSVGAIPWNTNLSAYFLDRIGYSQLAVTFSGTSDLLERTAIVPTLDSPCPMGRNVIWCSSFQLAWNRMRDDVIGAPVEVTGAEEVAARLNAAEQSEADMEADSFYAAAGRVKEGIIGKIHKDMADKFPSHTVPDFNEIALIPEGILSYSYLTANVPFKYPFRQVERDFTFTDANGVETNVGAFGAWGWGSVYKRMREQVEVLYVLEDRDATDPDLRMKEFVIDLCRYSEPYQVVAAVVERKGSLAETLDYIRERTPSSGQNQDSGHKRAPGSSDVLIVPEMFWEIDHRFDELIGKIVANADPAMPIVEARQAIKFRLDRYGAMLESEATIAAAAIPRLFIFNRPFLVYMKKRGSEQPFFVMWVDNAELLNRK